MNQMAEPTYEELKAKLAALEAEKATGLSFKVSEKGALSVYGLGRFPVTLYQEQWKKLLEKSGAILEFIEANKDKLKTKG
jgi:hypothetical protein